jgi:hypothetical protein
MAFIRSFMGFLAVRMHEICNESRLTGEEESLVSDG